MSNWSPLASLATLKQKAQFNARIRNFFSELGVMEVDVPVLGTHTVSDPYLDALSVELQGDTHYLQTSPEYFMKRLLAAGSGDIYYLGKAFRADEHSRLHRPEFTMLEWYRLHFSDQALIDELFSLVATLAPGLAQAKRTYADVFEQCFGVNPHFASDACLANLAREHVGVDWKDEARNTWLDLLFTHVIEPKLGEGLVAVYDYPASQCALARCQHERQSQGETVEVAKRFEVFLNGVELANGYWELSDAAEQRRRFELDNHMRARLGKDEVALDENLLAAVEAGLPDCAGVALGLDRLFMALMDLDSIHQQATF